MATVLNIILEHKILLLLLDISCEMKGFPGPLYSPSLTQTNKSPNPSNITIITIILSIPVL